MTPVAPDYVNQVRGIIGDLRENYLKKAQLSLQEQQLAQQKQLEENRLNFSYAQLNQQAANQAQAAEINTARIAAADAQNASDLIKSQAAAQAKAVERDLDERKFKWSQLKDLHEVEQKQVERDQELAASSLENEFRIALESDDPTKLIEVTNKASGSILNLKQRNDAYKNAMALVSAKRQLDQDQTNVKTQGQAIDLINEINFTKVDGLSPESLRNKIDDVNKRYAALGNRDERLASSLSAVTQTVAKRHDDYLKSELGTSLGEFEDRANLGQLIPDYQKKWDELQNDPKYSSEEAKSSTDYVNKKRRIMFEANKAKSIETLKAMDAQNIRIGERLMAQNKYLGAPQIDPRTGETVKDFPIAPPDLTPSVGYDGAIDPQTGKLTKIVKEANKRWVDDVQKPGYLDRPDTFMRMTQNLGMAPITGQSKEELEKTASLKPRVTSPSKFDMVQAPGTATIPTVPGTQKAQLSPETMSKVAEVVSIYNANPDALYRGRPVREIVAKLKQQLGELPGLGQTPESNIVNQGQNR
jgi:hypothetical protein